jgi:peptidyl-prolyl cis-trans isomerase SurA
MNSTCPDALRRLLVLTALALFALPALAAPILLDRIVAVVNNSVITASELDRKVDQTLRQLAARDTPAPPRAQLSKQLLERMITEKALLQTAEETNIKVDGETLDRTLNRIAAQNNMDLASFRANLEKDGVPFEDFRQQIRSEMTIVRLREREIDNRVVVTDAEIDNYLNTRKQDPNKQTEYNLAHILVLSPEGASPEKLAELRVKAEKALAELNAAGNFAQVSAAYSDAQNALQGGVMGWRSEAKLPSLFVDAVKGIAVGAYTPVLRSANGFHILKLLDKRGVDVTLVVKQSHARHILIKPNELISDQDAYVRLMELRDRLVNGGADFQTLARQHSTDLSAEKGGDLGWLNPGDTVAPFERAMNALDLNAISEPVRSQFGWHLIQVVERRDQDISEERQRLDARRALRERKSEEAFDDWVRLTRDRAYVEYRLQDQ